ncbi:MAG: hypothetical protein LWX55_12980 [Deltaproteobacteria bacterium]|nr:hypothetical protein [Deltaproteobacteria bacterium]
MFEKSDEHIPGDGDFVEQMEKRNTMTLASLHPGCVILCRLSQPKERGFRSRMNETPSGMVVQRLRKRLFPVPLQ